MSKEIELSIMNPKELYKVTRALASEVRINIIRQLNIESMNVVEIAERLNIPASTAGVNVRILEDAGLINTELQPGTRGSMKLCSRKRDVIKIVLENPERFIDKSYDVDMPIGSYVDCYIEPTCGMVSEYSFIGVDDEPRVFYNPDRINAQLIWFAKGYLEYRFPNAVLIDKKAKYIEVSAELCSEAPNYRSDWPSDITMWINGTDCGTWTCESDFGDRRGKLNPEWWSSGNTQYGILKTWRVSGEGTFIDGKKTSNTTINKLKLEKNNFIAVRIGIKNDAQYIGGINLFGERFGNHAQNIIMRVDYE